MIKILILVILLLIVPCYSLAVGVCTTIGSSGVTAATGCNPDNHEIGNRVTLGTIMSVGSDYARAFLSEADCSGTLSYCYIYHRDTTTENEVAKICIYTDDGDNVADAGDTPLTSSVCSIASWSGADGTIGEWVSTAEEVGGTVTNGGRYWIVVIGNSATYNFSFDFANSGGLGNASWDGTFSYSTPPANLDSGTSSDSDARGSVYCTIK